MRTKAPALLPLFRSDLQAKVLAILLLDAEQPVPTPELARRTGAAAASLHRELRRLEDAGLIEHDTVGRTKRYRAATASPAHQPLRALMELTLGIEPLLRERLSGLPGIESAEIFGSWAAGSVTPTSDVDVLVIGDVERAALLDAIREVERIAGREISVTALRREEFERRREEDGGLVATILRRPRVPLVGETA